MNPTKFIKLGPVCSIMVDEDEDEIVVCCAALTTFICPYLSANMASNHGPVQNMPYAGGR